MSDEHKKLSFEVLRLEFTKFIEAILKLKGAPLQKQQALLKFDEGHMWLQNAIVNYIEPKQEVIAELTPEQLQQAIKDGAEAKE